MISKVRIPTLLGLGVLLVGLAVGVFFTTQKSPLFWGTKAAPSILPQKITLANLSATSASIYWQTNEKSSCFLQTGTTTSLGTTFRDDRDREAPKPYRLHFVTLSNLSPNTIYFYKISCNSTFYPLGTPLSFKTLAPIPSSNLSPIIGTVVDKNFQAVEETLVVLDIPGAQSLATITKFGGNFLLPFPWLYNNDLTQSFSFPESSMSAILTIFNQEKSSRINCLLPQKEQVLPLIILGQDLDLLPKPATPAASLKYDLNSDGVVNSLDLSIVYKNFGPLRSEASKNPKQKKADLNNDGVVDKKDVEAITPLIYHSPQP